MKKILQTIVSLMVVASILAGCKANPTTMITPTTTAATSMIVTTPVISTTEATISTTTEVTTAITTTAATTPAATTPTTAATTTASTTSTPVTTSPTEFYPTGGWRISDPASQGVDASQLDALMTYISTKNLAVDSVVVIRHGYFVYEKYPNVAYQQNTKHQIYSCSKSILGAMIGIAIEEGYIHSLQDKMLDYFPDRTIANLDSRKSNITLENLMKMNAGMAFNEWALPYSDPNNAWIKAITSPDPIQYILDLPMAAEPGTVWNYCGGYTYLLSAILMKATNMTLLEFTNKYLFVPMGITDVRWDKNANVSKTIPNFYDAAGGLFLTPRDMAKFGYLILHNGIWNGVQLIPSGFVKDSTKVQSSFNYNSGYGYESWWTYQAENMYYAAGIYGQKIFIVPSLDLVVVFTGTIYTDVDTYNHNFMTNYIIPACK